MEEALPLGSRGYFGWLALLALARGSDFLSTWIASPNLVLEGNPISRKLGWTWGLLVNAVLCVWLARWPLPALILGTMSVLLASRNFQMAWAMRTSGEENYRDWFVQRLEETPPGLFLFCLLGQTGLVAAVGGALIYASDMKELFPLGIGLGIVGYAVAVAFYTLLSLWRNRRRFYFNQYKD
jgi:hypothetical protein